jgi:hypothetical protein
MDDLTLPQTDTERYVVCGWSALERGDLTEARAALQELYTSDPTHPGLPLLAAGIRRLRPKPVPWRAGVLLILVVAAGIVAFRSWNGRARVIAASQPTTKQAAIAPLRQSATPAEVRREPGRTEVGTAGRAEPVTELPAVKQNPSLANVDEDVVVRQAVQRFEGTYRSRWGALAFEHCDVSREGDQATAICTPRSDAEASAVESTQVWRFSLRKADGAWKIASVQPPPNSSQ